MPANDLSFIACKMLLILPIENRQMVPHLVLHNIVFLIDVFFLIDLLCQSGERRGAYLPLKMVET